MTTTRLLGTAFALLALASLAACSTSEAHPTQAPGSQETASVVGTWHSDSTNGVQIIVSDDSGFGISGHGCSASGTWSEENGVVEVLISALPGIAGCPDTMTLDLGSIRTIDVSGQGKLIAEDSRGHRESFSTG